MGAFQGRQGSTQRQLTGLDVLKAVWNIQDDKPARDVPPVNPNTDIYNTPSQRKIPRRPHN